MSYIAKVHYHKNMNKYCEYTVRILYHFYHFLFEDIVRFIYNFVIDFVFFYSYQLFYLIINLSRSLACVLFTFIRNQSYHYHINNRNSFDKDVYLNSQYNR